MSMEKIINKLAERGIERNKLVDELLEGVNLKTKYGIVRHEIYQMQRICVYLKGEWCPTGKANVVMKDGTKHVVDSDDLTWKDEWAPNGLVTFKPNKPS